MADHVTWSELFKHGDAEALKRPLVDILMKQQTDGSSSVFIGRAVTLIGAIIPILVWMRDNHGTIIDVAAVRLGMKLSSLEAVAAHPVKDMPDILGDAVLHYLKAIPGYQEAPPRDQDCNATLQEQHTYVVFPALERMLDTVRTGTVQAAPSI